MRPRDRGQPPVVFKNASKMSDIESAKQLFFEALDLLDARHYARAELRLRDALQLAPQSVSILANLSVALLQQGKPQEALSFAERASGIDPRNVEALLVMANCHAQERNFTAALATCDRIIALEPRLADIHSNRAVALNGLQRHQEALDSCNHAIALQPRSANAHNNRGNALVQLGRSSDALIAYDRALEIAPDLAEAWAGRGQALARLNRHAEALVAFDRAIALNPKLSGAWLGRAIALSRLGRFDDSLGAYATALALERDIGQVLRERGSLHLRLNRLDEAFADFDRAFSISPELPFLEGERLHAKMHLCDWRSFDRECGRLLASIASGKLASLPFPVIAIASSPEDQRRCAELYMANCLPQPPDPPLWRGERHAHPRIRLAYLSPDFREHPTAYLTAGLFGRHDRSRFEITAISFGPDDDSDMRRRLMRSFDRFLDVRDRSDRQIAELIHDMEIDIAVDLAGHTQHSRPNILAARPAPVQASYLGYPGTTGAGHIDYLIADRMVIPPEHRAGYSERIVYLPDSYQVNDRERTMVDVAPTRADLGLPPGGFVFCCFNNTFKITPDVFDVWMGLLRATDESVLWLLAGHATAMTNLRREAAARGVSGDRLIFAPRAKLDLHLARHRQADLFLDTFHCGAHTTASDALWAGLPVLTCPGPTFASRVSASLLQSLRLPELIASSAAEYGTLGATLAREQTLLGGIREQLRRNRETCALFDTARFTRHIEAAYRAMWERSQRNESPTDISIDAID